MLRAIRPTTSYDVPRFTLASYLLLISKVHDWNRRSFRWIVRSLGCLHIARYGYLYLYDSQ